MPDGRYARSLAGQRVGLLGLTFKAGTDDLRDSPALTVAELLAAEGADLIGYDPGVPAAVPGMTDDLQVTDDPLKVASGAAALVVLTEWPEFRLLDWGRLAELVERRIVIDTRNVLDADVLFSATAQAPVSLHLGAIGPQQLGCCRCQAGHR